MNTATPSATGTAITSAIALEMSVPAARARMPNLWVPSGLHSFVVQKFALSWLNAGRARQIKKIAMAASTASSAMPAPRARPANAASARLLLRDGCNGTLSGCRGCTRQWCETESGRRALARGDRIGEVTLQQVQAGEARRVLAADDGVAHRRYRVRRRAGRCVVDRFGQVRRRARRFGRSERRADVLRRQLDVRATRVLHLRKVELVGRCVG